MLQHQFLQFLYTLGENTIKFGLETTHKMTTLFDEPHYHSRIIHCAGTNGKGSTLITLEKLLIESGYTVGTTISPHLISYNERFRYQSQPINDNELEELFLYMCRTLNIDLCNLDNNTDWVLKPTFFEFSILLALLWFRKKKVDFILLETGMGGRLDATNVVNPLLTIITPISLDHIEFLGNTISEIAQEKLGIVKKKVPLILSKQSHIITNQVKHHCKNTHSPLSVYGEDYRWIDNSNGKIFIINETPFVIGRKIHIYKNSLLGVHQWENMATSLAAYFSVVDENKVLNEEKINNSLSHVKWSARIEYMNVSGTTLLIDGAHNDDSLQVLYDYLCSTHSHDKIMLCISWMKNKNIDAGLSRFSSCCSSVQPITFNNQRAAPYSQMKTTLENSHFNNIQAPLHLESFVEKLNDGFYKEYLVLLTGSLFFIGDFLGTHKKYCSVLEN